MSELRDLRLSRNIQAKDMVAVIQEIYPRYDKTMQSKCENGEAYGVMLRPDAMAALYKAFYPATLEGQQKKKTERHRLTKSIKARLPDDQYEALQQCLRADGMTAQALITAAVQKYLQERVTP